MALGLEPAQWVDKTFDESDFPPSYCSARGSLDSTKLTVFAEEEHDIDEGMSVASDVLTASTATANTNSVPTLLVVPISNGAMNTRRNNSKSTSSMGCVEHSDVEHSEFEHVVDVQLANYLCVFIFSLCC